MRLRRQRGPELWEGGAIYAGALGLLRIHACTFRNNVAGSPYSYGGGAIGTELGNRIEITSSMFERDFVSVGERAAFLDIHHNIPESPCPVVENCLLRVNDTETPAGFAFRIDTSAILFSNNRFEDLGPSRCATGIGFLNTHWWGWEARPALLIGNTFHRASAQPISGPSIYTVDPVPEFIMTGNTFVRTPIHADGARGVFENNICFDSHTCYSAGMGSIACNDFWVEPLGVDPKSDPEMHDNFEADPLFCDEAAGDLRLEDVSLCAPENSPSDCGLIGALGVGCGVTEVEEAVENSPERRILQVMPNPTPGRTEIRCALPEGELLRLTVFDARGRQMRTCVAQGSPEGMLRLEWDGRDASGAPVPAGTYFVRADGSGRRETARVTIVR